MKCSAKGRSAIMKVCTLPHIWTAMVLKSTHPNGHTVNVLYSTVQYSITLGKPIKKFGVSACREQGGTLLCFPAGTFGQDVVHFHNYSIV